MQRDITTANSGRDGYGARLAVNLRSMGGDTKLTNWHPGLDVFPVFFGLDRSRVTGREIASILGVAPPTVSRWRHGRVAVPAAKLAFLTFLLADWLDEAESGEDLEDGGDSEARDAARRCLVLQEAYNATLPPAAIREGALMFQDWWRRGGRLGDESVRRLSH